MKDRRQMERPGVGGDRLETVWRQIEQDRHASALHDVE
jgi:hypothetical protein